MEHRDIGTGKVNPGLFISLISGDCIFSGIKALPYILS